MEKNAPENVFGIAEEIDISSANKGSGVEASDNKSEENIVPETKEMTLDDLKSYLQKNNITVNEENIQNYYNQIIENKKYITEYNQTIKELEEAKNSFSNTTEDAKTGEDSNKLITSKISQIEKQLADLNVEKQKKEDNIKSTINNIFNENKTENSKNVKFETKNTILNMTLNDQKPNVIETKEPEKNLEKENTPKEEILKEEENFLRTPKEEIKKEEESNVQIKETENANRNQISNMEKIDNSNDSSKFEERAKETGSDISFLSEEMKKGFESVLNAIQGIIEKNQQTQKEKQQESRETPKQSQSEIASNTQERVKTPQKNYIEEYRESLRSNAPINGFVGIKGMELKANNIGSYL